MSAPARAGRLGLQLWFGALALGALLAGCETDMDGAADYVASVGGLIDHSPPARPSLVQIFIASTRRGETATRRGKHRARACAMR